MLWEYGPAIYKFIEQAFDPSGGTDIPDSLGIEDDEDNQEAFNPFSIWEGANFKLVAYIADNGYRTYDKSKWLKPSEVANGDESKQEEIYNSLYSLQAENDESKYKSYDELKKRFDYVVGNVTPRSHQKNDDGENDDVDTVASPLVTDKEIEDEFDEFMSELED